MTKSIDITPEHVLKPTYLVEHAQDISALHAQIAGLRTNLFILERLAHFPFGIFVPHQTMFWAVVIRNIYFSSLVAAWGIAFDTDARSLTVSRFKNAVVSNIAKPDVATSVRSRLAALNLEAVRDRLRPRLDDLRNKAIAHLDRALLTASPGQPVKLPAISLVELNELCTVLGNVINVLGFGTAYNTLPVDYDPATEHPRDTDSRPDIEQLLDDLARRSEYLNMPEDKPDEWPFLCVALSDDDLDAINRYRVKFGLTTKQRPAT